MVDIPPKPLRSPERIEESFHAACRLTSRVGSPLNPAQAARLLDRHGLHTVVGGSQVASSWGGVPTGRLEMTLITTSPERARRLLRAQRVPLLTLVQSTKNRFWRLACAAAIKVAWKRCKIQILSSEFSLVSCWCGMIDRRLEYLDRLQHAAYFAFVATNCGTVLSDDIIRHAANTVRRGGASEVFKQIDDARANRWLQF